MRNLEELAMLSCWGDHFMSLCTILLVCLTSVVHSYVANVVIEVQRPIACWTCPSKQDNGTCSNLNSGKSCPKNYTMCQTIHRINMKTGTSVRVNKRCALPRECTLDMVGCHDTNTPGIQECVSCCNYAYCNDYIPVNHTNLLHLSSSGHSLRANSSCPGLLLYTLLLAIVWRIISHIHFGFTPGGTPAPH